MPCSMSRAYPPFVAGARSVAYVVFGSLVMLLAARSVAHAHASLVSSEPAANAHLSVSPTRVRLLFSEETEPTLARLSLVADDGTATRLVVAGDLHDVNAIVAPIGPLAPGSYRLVWRVVSADGHPVEGSIVFWIGDSAAQPLPVAPAALNVPSTWGPTVIGAPVVPATLRGSGLDLSWRSPACCFACRGRAMQVSRRSAGPHDSPRASRSRLRYCSCFTSARGS